MYHVLYSILYHRKKIAVVTCSAVLDSESGRKLLATRNNYHMHAIVGELLSGSAFRLEQAELISHGAAGGFMRLDDSTESYRAKMTGHRAKKMNFPRQGECVLTTSHVLPNPSRASERECP